jgi:hypothetical protein
MKASAKGDLGYHRLKHNKPWFDDECSKKIDKRKQAKSQLLQNAGHINGDTLQNLRCEISRKFKKKKREYTKGKVNNLNLLKKSEIRTEA